MPKYEIGDILIPNKVIYNDEGNILEKGNWCDHDHKYIIEDVNTVEYRLRGITNGRSTFFLRYIFTERNYKLEDDACGDCKNRCRSKKGKCEFYQEMVIT